MLKMFFVLICTAMVGGSFLAIAKSYSAQERQQLHRARISKCQERCKALNDPNPECVHHCELLPLPGK